MKIDLNKFSFFFFKKTLIYAYSQKRVEKILQEALKCFIPEKEEFDRDLVSVKNANETKIEMEEINGK